jgi:hypothetical protein
MSKVAMQFVGVGTEVKEKHVVPLAAFLQCANVPAAILQVAKNVIFVTVWTSLESHRA